MNLLTLMEAMNEEYTKSERILADYIIENYQQIIYMSISELAEACEVGDATVTRFCRTLNLKGYQEFKMLLAQSIPDNDGRNHYVENIEVDDSVNSSAKKILQSNVVSLTRTFNNLDYEQVTEAVKLINSADEILFIGLGSSGVTAIEGTGKFIRILPNVSYLQDIHFASMKVSLMSPKSLIIAFSFSGSTKDLLDIVTLAKANNIKLLSITSSTKSPLAQLSDVVLNYFSEEGPFQGGSLSTKMSQLFVLDVLYSEVFKSNYEMFKKRKANTTSSITDKLL